MVLNLNLSSVRRPDGNANAAIPFIQISRWLEILFDWVSEPVWGNQLTDGFMNTILFPSFFLSLSNFLSLSTHTHTLSTSLLPVFLVPTRSPLQTLSYMLQTLLTGPYNALPNNLSSPQVHLVMHQLSQCYTQLAWQQNNAER